MIFHARCGLALLNLLAITFLFRAHSMDRRPEPDDPTSPPPGKPELALPEWWNPSDPLPNEKPNCVRCHLTAGRELTAAVRDYARSVHDKAKLSCYDCHGGNTEDDATAHEQEFEFIGTKLSAHMNACADCHTDEADAWRKSPHFWDLSQRINRDYPVCLDCHGNHDVGNPPADFALMNVCTDCHKNFEQQFPETASVVAENDRLWKILQVATKSSNSSDSIPARFRRELSTARYATARLMHSAIPPTKEQATALSLRSRRLRDDLDAWLRSRGQEGPAGK